MEAPDAPRRPHSRSARSACFARERALLHDDRGADASARTIDQLACCRALDSGHLHHDALAAVDELRVRCAQVDHEIAERLAERIIAPVVIVLSTSFVAVPAFMRVEPVTASGP